MLDDGPFGEILKSAQGADGILVPGGFGERGVHMEVNHEMVAQLENAGLSFVGRDESGQHMEIIELPSHPYFVGIQFHPEFKSRPGKPYATFLGLIGAASGQLEAVLKNNGHTNQTLTNGMSNGKPASKPHPNGHQNGHAVKLSNGSMVNSVYSNGNGLHH